MYVLCACVCVCAKMHREHMHGKQRLMGAFSPSLLSFETGSFMSSRLALTHRDLQVFASPVLGLKPCTMLGSALLFEAGSLTDFAAHCWLG